MAGKETVDQYLARGGKITHVPRGTSKEMLQAKTNIKGRPPTWEKELGRAFMQPVVRRKGR